MLKQLSAYIDFDLFSDHFEEISKNEEEKDTDYVKLFKILVIQRYYGIGDDEIAVLIPERLDFREFLGLSRNDKMPDQQIIGDFKRKLTKSNVIYVLFSMLDDLLKEQGVTVCRGSSRQAFIKEVQPGKLIREGIGLSSNALQERVSALFLPGLAYPVRLRGDTTDYAVFQQVFQEGEYDAVLNFTPEFIIDCGANIGLASLYFKAKYPNATIVAVEPEGSNYALLEENLSYYYPDIYTLRSGIWNKAAMLSVHDEFESGNWGFTVKETDGAPENAVPAITISDILGKYGKEEIDLLKIDIEGAELELFGHGYENWLSRTKVLMIETHDHLRKGCSNSVFKALVNYDFSIFHKGENVICIRNDI